MNNENNGIGVVQSVDTGVVVVQINEEDAINNLQVNQVIKIKSTNPGECIIALIQKIMRKAITLIDTRDDFEAESPPVENLIKAYMIGTWYEKVGNIDNVFKRGLEVIPCIGSNVFLLDENTLKNFMDAVSSDSEDSFLFGSYSIQKDASALLDGNKLFQRHAVIVGGTGSGKSWTVANILEQSAKLSSPNSIVFDLHGEYQPLGELENTTTLKIAGPTDNEDQENLIFLPYWLLSYEETEALILDRTDNNAPNQARSLFNSIIEHKQSKLDEGDKEQKEILKNFTINSPIPYDLNSVLNDLKSLDAEKVPGSTAQGKQGPLYGKLTRFIQRLESKMSDKRLNFIFNQIEPLQNYHWLTGLVKKLMSFGGAKKRGIKIIDFSEVPSDTLPLITGLVARLVFSIQQWADREERHPIALFCDEAHLYIPQKPNDSIDSMGLHNFERISKEGRKYGVSLVIISQRPADVSKTVLSQCNNFIAMRLTNPDDQNVISKLFPDNLEGFSDLLPILDIGECLVVGDACLLPSRVKVNSPKIKPNSATVDVWTEWRKGDKNENYLVTAIKHLRQQAKLPPDSTSS